MTEEKPALTPERIAQNQATIDRLDKEYAEKDAQKKHDDMVTDLCATNPAFKNLHDKYKSEVFILNPALKTITDKNQMIAAFIPSAEILSERDKKIEAMPHVPAATDTKTATTPELDKPLPQANGTFKNKAGEVTDEKGNAMLSDDVRLFDARKIEIPTDGSIDKATGARLKGMRAAQSQVVRTERNLHW